MANGYNNRYNHSSSRSHSRRRRRRNNTPVLIGIGAVAVLVLIIGIIFIFKGCSSNKNNSESSAAEESTTEAFDHSFIHHEAVIDLNAVINNTSGIEDDNRINIKGMNADEIRKAVSDKYSWKLTLTNEKARVGDVVKPKVDIDETTEAATMGDPENPDSAAVSSEETTASDITVSDRIEVPDLIADSLDALIEEIFEADAAAETEIASDTAESSTAASDSASEEESSSVADAESSSVNAKVYALRLDNIDDAVKSIAKYASDMWYVEPLGGSIGSYDSSSDTFVMENSRDGFKPDKDKLASDIKSAISSKDYSGSIAVSGSSISAESSDNVSGPYQTLATFTTKTTSNAVRNKNIELACKKLNGTIVRPGEEFSFNQTVGQRTKEAGFGEAAAYNNGEVVQEVGGGVCQASTTLYNAVLKAGLKITARQSHTFKPTYVTPGMDATVSWGGPDFKFANLPSKSEYSYKSSYAIGIRASYSNQTVTVSIYGRPVLKSGYSYSLESTQTKTIDMVRKAIEEGSDKTPTKGSEGSVWEVRLIIKKDGEVVSNNVDHNSLYSGHIEYYYENDPSESASESQSESSSESAAESSSAAEGETSSSGPGGPASPSASESTAGTGSASGSGSASGTGPVSETSSAASQAPAPETSASGQAPGGGSSTDQSSGPIISSDGPGSISTEHNSSNGPGA